ncbi:polynucleotide adenylyltransferase PcnB [Dokdonella fugitiva]|jgi:poly(A) polymerase|uniref:Poly(A) polymerase I n=1 Tax=Dokdonella fugitiva TaxID=328517 RepID=A0A4V2S2V0_9GAMM|nr:polynucleotide adenylyltransferase PcnB [Dokdonella fugitiva]TCO41900.1 poly(A) polymerase [Dokdonella fugitiva]
MTSERIVQEAPIPGSFRIIPRPEHAISRKSISAGALRVLYRLHEAGHRACLVGGAVRDLLLGGHPKDFDVATDATPEQVRALFRNCRLIGRRFRLAHVVFGREIVEVATFRGSSDDGSGDRHLVDGRLVRDNVYGTIEEDAVRRDFTVNALYYDISDFSVLDSVGGMEDLQHRVLRLIGDPEQRYREDPVRMLRAARLAAKLGFTIEPATAAPFAALGPLLAEAPPARLFDESLKLFLSGHGLASFRSLEQHGLLQHVFPATARVLAQGDAAHFRRLVEQTLANTDARVREDKPVTPAFLFAALLWEPVRRAAQAAVDAGADVGAAWSHATERVLREQAQRVAVPRRFTIAVEEIWAMQPRFAQRTKKRAFRLLEHPRFRAAYDFLVLRADESPELAELAAWWTEAQQLDQDQLAERLASAPPPPGSEAPPATKRKRPRRRRRKKSGVASAVDAGD